MRLPIIIAVVIFISCGQNSSKRTETSSKDESTKPAIETIKALPLEKDRPITYMAPDEEPVNEMLKVKYGTEWHVLNDKEATWMKDAFDYFIVPKRKDNPNYPYITKGDFNGDDKADIAALVKNNKKGSYQIAIILGKENILFWQEDILEDAAISTLAKSDIEGMEREKPKKVKLKGDGIIIDYFERGSFVIYWDKTSFKRIQTGD